jgi:hypothetical protein
VTEAEQRREWHTDRKVTIGLILALLMHAGSTVWWAASINNRVAQLEQDVLRASGMPERMARLEALSTSQAEYLKRIDAKLDRLFERRN